MKRLEPFFSTTTWGHDGCEEREIHERPREDHNGGSEGVAGREGGGGVVGEPHSHSEKELYLASHIQMALDRTISP